MENMLNFIKRIIAKIKFEVAKKFRLKDYEMLIKTQKFLEEYERNKKPAD